MKKFKKNKSESIAEEKNSIIQLLVEFYKIQPGISVSMLEKLEEYLVLMNSYLIEALCDLNEISYNFEKLEDILDILNTYINSIVEENGKIFPDEDLEILPLNYPENVNLNEIQVLEYLRNINQGKLNRYNLSDLLIELDEKLYESDFSVLIIEIIEKLITVINSERIVKVEDLI
ncbi:MAG: hypothetical protein N4A59_07500 [Marinifilum sp.]|nr:hypothetical protein [Marinifilum sp.]